MQNWLRKHPNVRTIRVAAADLNGVPRGKRIPTRFADKVAVEGTRFPFSVLNLDIWGEDIDDSPLVFDSAASHRARIYAHAVAGSPLGPAADLDVPRRWPPLCG